jgi:hypothetical protein
MDEVRAILFSFILTFIGIAMIDLLSDWLKRKEKKSDNPQYIRFYKKGTYHIAKAISEEELEKIEKNESKSVPQMGVILLFNSDRIPVEENFDGVAESAIRIINQEWQNRDGNDGNEQVTTTW